MDAERKEQLRIMEEKEEQRMLEDNRKMKEELEKEKQKERDKIEEVVFLCYYFATRVIYSCNSWKLML